MLRGMDGEFPVTHDGVTFITLIDGREVAVDTGGHITVWDKDGEVEKEFDV